MNAPLDWTQASPETSLVIANVSRRKFLQTSALGGLVLAVGFPASLRAADAPKYGADGMPHGWVDSPLVFVAIGEDGTVSIVCHRSEMGQGVRTGMPMIVADELEADWSRVRVVQATGDEARYGNQDTDGSRSTRHFFMPMRRCGAAARQMLETAAAARWKVPVSEVQAGNGEVIHTATGRKLGYGALAKAAASVPLPAMDKVKLKDPSQFRYIGTGKLRSWRRPAAHRRLSNASSDDLKRDVDPILHGDCAAQDRERHDAELGLVDRETACRRNFFAGAAELHRCFDRSGGSVQRDGDAQRLSAAAGRMVAYGDRRVGIAVGLEHSFQHVAPGPLDVGGRRLRVESDLRPQFGLVDNQRIKRNIEVGATLARSDESGDVVTRDHVVVPELRQ